MAQNAPGKHYRKGMSLVEIMRRFPDTEAAERWFEQQFWPGGPFCPRCGSVNVQVGISHSTMTHRCRDCKGRPMFSLKSGTPMEGSKLSYQVWAIAIYLLTTNLKWRAPRCKLRTATWATSRKRRLGIVAHRIRKSLERSEAPFSGPVEVDETYMGGIGRRRKLFWASSNMSAISATLQRLTMRVTWPSNVPGAVRDDVGAGERAPEFVRQAEADDGLDLGAAATGCCPRRPVPHGVQTPGQVAAAVGLVCVINWSQA